MFRLPFQSSGFSLRSLRMQTELVGTVIVMVPWMPSLEGDLMKVSNVIICIGLLFCAIGFCCILFESQIQHRETISPTANWCTTTTHIQPFFDYGIIGWACVGVGILTVGIGFLLKDPHEILGQEEKVCPKCGRKL